MNVNERIRHLRKDILHLTQQDFSNKLHISRSNMGNIEIGRIAVTDRIISSICREFDISEEWLRYGIGDPTLPRTRSQIITDFAAELIKDDNESFRRRLIETLASLDLDDWEALEKIANKLVKKD